MTAYWTRDEHADDYDEWVNGLLVNAPESFDDDVAAEDIVTRYVRWLEARRPAREQVARALADAADNGVFDREEPDGASDHEDGAYWLRLADAALASAQDQEADS